MADAYVSVPSGAEATYYNPAALSWIGSTAVSLNHTALYASINHDFFAASHAFGALGTVALSVTALYTDEMAVRTPLQPDGTGETFRVFDYRVGLSYARNLTDRVSFGATVNYVDLALYSGFSTTALAVDIATLYVTEFRDFSFGMMISNFGSNVRFVNEDYPLPTAFTFGASINALEGADQRLLVSASAVKPNDGRPLAQLGAEWSYDDLLHLRAGYRPGHDVASYSFGGGLDLGLGARRMGVDYAYSDYDVLGVVHRISLGLTL
jgi:hypothetical protein